MSHLAGRAPGQRARTALALGLTTLLFAVGCGHGSGSSGVTRMLQRDLGLSRGQAACVDGYVRSQVPAVAGAFARGGLQAVPAAYRERVGEIFIACTVHPDGRP